MAKFESMLKIRVSKELREALEAAAEDDERTPSNLVRKILAGSMRKQGYLKVPSKNKPEQRGKG